VTTAIVQSNFAALHLCLRSEAFALATREGMQPEKPHDSCAKMANIRRIGENQKTAKHKIQPGDETP
jgi:3-hydroxyisobutyrate dehydrogenase-like beta-hydroxyacid dehydrogenase